MSFFSCPSAVRIRRPPSASAVRIPTLQSPRFFRAFSRLSPRLALRVNNLESLEKNWSTAFSIQRFDQPTEISCYTSAMVRETKNKQKYFFCLKVCQRWCDEREFTKNQCHVMAMWRVRDGIRFERPQVVAPEV